MEKEINLPDEFEVNRFHNPTFRDGGEILDYCKSCMKKPGCEMNQNLRHAMGNDYYYWPSSFVSVRIPNFYMTIESISFTRAFCSEYESPQSKLPGVPETGFLDGVEKLIEILRIEEEDIKEKEIVDAR
tara:strand:+ start:444 stop:830 length:387 start_codon:yes stop_codon:yes gene_type:complete